MKNITVAFILFLCAKINASSLQKFKESPKSVVDINGEHVVVEPQQLDILSRIFNKDVLLWSEPDFLVRLYEAQMRGGEILTGRMEDIHMALIEKVARLSREEAIGIIYYAFRKSFNYAFGTMLRNLPFSLQEFIHSLDNLREAKSEEFLAMVQMLKDELVGCSNFAVEDQKESAVRSEDEDEFILIEHADATVRAYECVKTVKKLDLLPQKRLPALVRNLMNFTGASISDQEVNSQYLSNVVLNSSAVSSDLRAALVLHEVEMMDNSHSHDLDGAIDSYLTKKISFSITNVTMAQLAYEMYQNEFWAALKKIIDTKFSFKSPFPEPVVFLDLAGIFRIAEANHFSQGFNDKVLELARPSAIRRYNSLPKAKEMDTSLQIIDKEEFNDDDEMEEVVFCTSSNYMDQKRK